MNTTSLFIQIGFSQIIASILRQKSRRDLGRRLNKFRLICRSAIVILIWNGFSVLATIYDSDGSSTNIQYIHDSLAQDGDTITLPEGTFFWATTVTITKGITLVGQTTTDPVHKTANDQTIVIVNTGASGNPPLLIVDSAPGKSYRVSGITFRTGRTGVIDGNGMIRLTGDSHAASSITVISMI